MGMEMKRCYLLEIVSNLHPTTIRIDLNLFNTIQGKRLLRPLLPIITV